MSGLFATGSPAVASTPGPQWTGQTAPLPTSPNPPGATPGVEMEDLSCLSSSYCVGVGRYSDGTNTQSVFETYSGGTWSATEAPTPGTDSKFESVSCWEVGSCVAVGDYKDTSESTAPVIDVLSGGTWTSVDVPLPVDAATPGGEFVLDSLSSVSCQSDGSCVAVGGYKNSSGATNDVGLIETFAGGLWTAAAAPLPPSPDASPDVDLSQVSCPSADSCAAVGSYENASDVEEGQLLVEGSGGVWTAEAAPLPSNASGTSEVSSVSCAGATCEAGGQYEDAGSQEHGLLEHLSGGNWTGAETPEPADAGSGGDQDADVSATTCTAGDSCVAVGSYEDSGGDDVGMIESVQGGTPTVSRTPLPSDADPSNASDLSAVSCSAPGVCITAGDYLPTGGTEAGLIDTEVAGVWSAQTAPVPADTLTGASADAALGVLSCSPDGSCAAGGNYLDASSEQQGLLENFLPVAPTVTSLVPTSGPAAGGTTVTITGTGFEGGATAVAFGSSPSTSVTYVSPTELTAVTPAEATGPTGSLTVDVTVTTAGGTSAATAGDHYTFLASSGYWEVARDGGVFTFGTAAFYGSMGGQHLNAPIVGIASTPDRKGYWEVAADGGVFSFGDARFWGSTGSLHLNAPIVGIAPTPSGNGYWIVAADGGVFNYGDAGFWGSAGSLQLNKPVVGIAPSPDGNGYWLVASDGGIFNYGDAGFLGSAGSIALNKPVVGMAAPPTDGKGYWLVGYDGGIFNYGDAAFLGSAGSTVLNWPVEGMAAVTASPGYWLVAADGGVFSYGGAQFEGSMGGKPLVQPVVGIAEG